MRLSIELVTDSNGGATAAEVCRLVFERELGMNRAPAVDPLRSHTFLARLQPNEKPVGTLTVLDTTGEDGLHRKYGLSFPESAKVARYTRLAVLPPYRGMGISLRLMYEARRRFVLPERFEHSWLLFDAERAALSTLSMLLDFTAGDMVFLTEWGRTRVMVKSEARRAGEIRLGSPTSVIRRKIPLVNQS